MDSVTSGEAFEASSLLAAFDSKIARPARLAKTTATMERKVVDGSGDCMFDFPEKGNEYVLKFTSATRTETR
jgi:hypothetical protein